MPLLQRLFAPERGIVLTAGLAALLAAPTAARAQESEPAPAAAPATPEPDVPDPYGTSTVATDVTVPTPAPPSAPPANAATAPSAAPASTDGFATRPRHVSVVMHAFGNYVWKKPDAGGGRTGDVSGGGGGIGMAFSVLLGSHPTPTKADWMAAELGTGLDFGAVSAGPTGVSETYLRAAVPLIVGVRSGIGDIEADGRWSGAQFGVAWAPQAVAYVEELERLEDGISGIAPLSVQASADFGKLAPGVSAIDAAFRVYGRYTHGTGDMLNTLTLGLGASFQ